MNLRKGLFILPNLFTLSSLFCGLYAIVRCTSQNSPTDFLAAAVAIIFAMLFDMVDGRVARLTRTQSDFGMQMDSLVDLVSFGVAPALLIYTWGLKGLMLGTLDMGFVVAFVYAGCGAIRLARFNVLSTRAKGKTKSYFVGLPIPLAAGMLMAIVLGYHGHGTLEQGQFAIVGVTLLLSFLMVSKVKYRSFKNTKMTKRFAATMFLIVSAAVVVATTVRPSFSLVLLFSFYIFLGLAEELMSLRLHRVLGRALVKVKPRRKRRKTL